MADAVARVTGEVRRVITRKGNKTNEDTGEIKPWSMTTVRVLVGGEGFADVTANEALPVIPERGDKVDWLVSVRSGGRFLNMDYLDDFYEDAA